MPEQLLDPPPLVSHAGNGTELAGREGGRHGNLPDRRGLAWRRPKRAVRTFDWPVIIERFRCTDVVRQTELDGFGAVGDGAPTDSGDEVGACLSRRRSGLDDGAARRVRQHAGEDPGTAVPQRPPHLVDLAGRAAERAAHHQEDAFGAAPPRFLGDCLGGGLAEHHRIHFAKFDASRSRHRVSLPTCWLQRI